MTKGWTDGQIKDPGTKMKITKRWVTCLHHDAGSFVWKHTTFLVRKGLSGLPEHRIPNLSICLYACTPL